MSDISNYADDTTPFVVDKTIDSLLESLEKDTAALIKWFRDNYLKLNADKCHLLISNHNRDITIMSKRRLLNVKALSNC